MDFKKRKQCAEYQYNTFFLILLLKKKKGRIGKRKVCFKMDISNVR